MYFFGFESHNHHTIEPRNGRGPSASKNEMPKPVGKWIFFQYMERSRPYRSLSSRSNSQRKNARNTQSKNVRKLVSVWCESTRNWETPVTRTLHTLPSIRASSNPLCCVADIRLVHKFSQVLTTGVFENGFDDYLVLQFSLRASPRRYTRMRTAF